MSLRVLLADDELVTLEGVRLVLDAAAGIAVVGEAHSGEELCTAVPRTSPEIVLLNPALRGFADEADRFNALTGERDLKVVVFSESTSRTDIERAFEAGAAAYIVKTIHPLSLPAALRVTADGTVFHNCHFRRAREASNGHASDLTARERDILAAVAAGLSNRAISRQLSVSEQTVKFHLANVYRKIGVLSRTGAVRYALDRGVVSWRTNAGRRAIPHANRPPDG